MVISSIFSPFPTHLWQHLSETVLNTYVVNSLLLTVGVGIGTFILGVASAWLISTCDFPGRRFFEWALLLPMAMPAYIIAYTYSGMLSYSGPVQSLLREVFGWQFGDYWFPNVHSLTGAIVMLSLVLYPYVYFIVRAAFVDQSRAVIEASRSLGRGPRQTFFRVALPLARPAIAAGVSLAMMEALADYGTVQYFGVSTFTTGIFRTWFGLGSPTVAAQLSSILLVFVFSLVVLERWSRKRMKFHHATSSTKPVTKITLSARAKWCSVLFCASLLLCGFLLPVFQLLAWVVQHWKIDFTFLQLVANSFLLSVLTASVCLVVAVLLAYGQRLFPFFAEKFLVRLSALGYAIPGTVIAVGVVIPFGWLDNRVNDLTESLTGNSIGLIFSGTIFILIFAYVVRFLAVALNSMEAGLEKIRPTIDDAGRSLGLSSARVLQQVHLPLLRTSMVTALLLVFVDVLKELPATLILRPFNFNTLAVRAFELASDERLAEASLPALAIVLIGLIPVIIMTRTFLRKS